MGGDLMTASDIYRYFESDISPLEKAQLRPFSDLREFQQLSMSTDKPECSYQGKVMKSWKIGRSENPEVYVVEISLKKENGKTVVERAVCQCTAGPGSEGHCTHIAVMLIALSATVTRTQLPAVWKNPSVAWCQREAKPVSALIPQTLEPFAWPSDAVMERFAARTLEAEPCTVQTLFRPKGHQIHNISCSVLNYSVPVLLQKYEEQRIAMLEQDLDPPKLEDVFELDNLTRSHLQKVSDVSTTYERTFWTAVRQCRFTGSNIMKIYVAMTRNPDSDLPYSIEEAIMCDGPCISSVPAIQWGRVHEAEALKAYSTKTNKEVFSCGTLITPSGALGATPDGMREDGILIKVKCPFKIKDQKIRPAVEKRKLDFLETDHGVLNLKKGHLYYFQVQTQLHVWEAEVCHFVVWTSVDIEIIPVLKEESFAEKLKFLERYYFSHFLPYLLSERRPERVERVKKEREEKRKKKHVDKENDPLIGHLLQRLKESKAGGGGKRDDRALPGPLKNRNV